MKLRHLLLSVLLFVFAAHAWAEVHIIVADHETRKVIKIKEDGTLLWDARNDNGHDVQLLANGNLLIVCGRTVQEVNPDKKVVREIGKPVVEAAESAQRLKNGNTVIADNGKGFDTKAAASAGHNGLDNMHRRAAAVGGKLGLASAPGSGTRVELSVGFPG